MAGPVGRTGWGPPYNPPTLRRWRDILGGITVDGAAVAAVGAFALWTLCANLVYAMQWPLLLAAGVWCVGAGGGGGGAGGGGPAPSPSWGVGRAGGRPPRALLPQAARSDSAPHPNPLPTGERGSERVPVLFAAALTFLAWRVTGQFLALWAGAVVVGISGIWANRGAGDAADDPAAPRREWVVWALAGVAAVLALLVRSYSVDDAYYLNRAAQLAENVWAAVPRHYALFGDAPGSRPMPFPYPTFPLTAYHDLIGLLSAATWLQPLRVASIVCAPVAAGLVPVAYAVLLRRVLPGRVWPWALGVAMALLLVEGTGERFVSQFGLPRIWQGKSILLHVGLPLVLAWGMDLGRSGRVRDAARVSAALVALVGLNSMGIWIGPVTAGMGVAVGWLSGNPHGSLRDSAKRGAVALTVLVGACWYPIVLGWLYVGASGEAVGYRLAAPDVAETLLLTFGSERVMAVWVALLLVAPAVVPTAAGRLLAAVTLAVTFGLGLNPWLAPRVAEHVTSGVLYWRVFWLLPAVPLVACVFCAGFPLRRHVGRAELLPGLGCRPAATGAGLLAAVLVYGALVPEHGVISRGNRVGLGWPGVKAPAGPWAVAGYLRERLPPDAPVLAPTSVSWLLVTMTDAPSAIVPRPIAVEHAFARQLGDAAEARRRLALANYLGGQKHLDPVHLWDAIERDRVSALVLRPSAAPPGPAGDPGSAGPHEPSPRDVMAPSLSRAERSSVTAERQRLRDRLIGGGFIRSDVAGFEVWLRKGLGADER